MKASAVETNMTTIAGLQVKVHYHENFTEEEIIKHHESMRLLHIAVNSEEFKLKLLLLKLTNTRGLSHQQIYELIMTGKETLSNEVDQEIDIYVAMYFKNNKVVGYTYETTERTYLNRKFFKSYEPAEVACNAFHEWLHKLGFDHHSASEHTSIPYALGYLVRELCGLLMKGNKLTPIQPGMIFEYPQIPERPTLVRKCSRPWYLLGLKEICKWDPE